MNNINLYTGNNPYKYKNNKQITRKVDSYSPNFGKSGLMDRTANFVAKNYFENVFTSKFTQWLSKKTKFLDNVVDNLQILGSAIISGTYMYGTLASKQMDDKKRQKTLATNQGLTFAASTIGAMTLDSALNNQWEKFTRKYILNKTNLKPEYLNNLYEEDVKARLKKAEKKVSQQYNKGNSDFDKVMKNEEKSIRRGGMSDLFSSNKNRVKIYNDNKEHFEKMYAKELEKHVGDFNAKNYDKFLETHEAGTFLNYLKNDKATEVEEFLKSDKKYAAELEKFQKSKNSAKLSEFLKTDKSKELFVEFSKSKDEEYFKTLSKEHFFNTLLSKFSGNLKGMGVFKKLLIFGTIYRFVSPVAVTPLANKIGNSLFKDDDKK